MQITISGLAKEGDGVGRCVDGRAIFVRGALPDEKVSCTVTEEKPKFLDANCRCSRNAFSSSRSIL